jgi:hypothetical protein
MFGLTQEDYVTENVIEILEEHLPAVLLFDEMGTQWRCGPTGAYGLDYNVLFHKLDRMKLNRDEYDELEYQIRILEGAALEEMRKE